MTHDSHASDAANMRGLGAYQRGDYDAALTEFSTAIAADPLCGLSYLNRATVWLRRYAYDKAIADATAALALALTAEQMALAYDVRSSANVSLGRCEDALADLTMLLEVSPHNGRAHYARGLALQRMARHAEAAEAFSAALAAQLPPELFSAALTARAWTRVSLAQHAEAVEEINALIRQSPNAAELYFTRGQVLLALKNFPLAIRDLCWYADAVPQYPPAAMLAARVLCTCPDPAARDGRRAIIYAERACHLTWWKDGAALAVLAAAFAEQGDWPSAVNWAHHAVLLATPDVRTQREHWLELFRRGEAVWDDSNWMGVVM